MVKKSFSMFFWVKVCGILSLLPYAWTIGDQPSLDRCHQDLAIAKIYKTSDGALPISTTTTSSPSTTAVSKPLLTIYDIRTKALESCKTFTPEQVLGISLIQNMDEVLEIGHLALITYENCKLYTNPILQNSLSSTVSSSSTCLIYQSIALQYYKVAYNTTKGQTDPYLIHNFGILLRNIGFENDALYMFQRAIALHSTDPGPYIEVGLMYRHRNLCTDALKVFLQGLNVPGIAPGSHNEYALISNIFAMLMNCGDIPSDLLYQTLTHSIIKQAAVYYPHVAMFIAHVRGITGQWGMDADENADQLLNAFISAQSIFLTSSLSYSLLTTTFLSSEFQKYFTLLIPSNHNNNNKKNTIYPNTNSSFVIDLKNWNLDKFSQLQRQLLLSPGYDNSTSKIEANILTWLRIPLTSSNNINIYDISKGLTDIPHATILADSFGNTAAFEISYIELPQWIMPFASAISSLIRQNLQTKEISIMNYNQQFTPLNSWYTLRKHNISKPVIKKRLPKLRLAYISPDFRRHAIGYMMFGTFAAHNRSVVHVTAYHTKEIGNKFGLRGMFRIPQRIEYINITSNVPTKDTKHKQISGDNNCSNSTKPSSSSSSKVIISPDWSDAIIERGINHHTLSPYLDWAAWARQYISYGWSFSSLNTSTTDNNSRQNPYVPYIGSQYCSENYWTHTSRLATVSDAFYSSLLWPNHSTDDIVSHMNNVTLPHILIDLAGPTFGNTGPVCRARPAVLTVHYLSGPISTGSRNDADFAIVDKVILPPDIAFHAPNQPAELTLIQGYRNMDPHILTKTNPHTQSATIIAQSMIQGIPSLLQYRNESMIKYKSTNNITKINHHFRTPIIRDFTESLVYINLPFQANTLPSYENLPLPPVSIQDQSFNCPYDNSLPLPCSQLYFPLLGSSMIPLGTSSSSSTSSTVSNSSTSVYSSYLCPNRNRVVFAALYGSVKITPHAYTAWMNILRQVSNSDLWLLISNSRTGEGVYAQTMWAEATARGIHPSRIVFVTESPRETFWYLFPCIDVFLDTWIYGAHSTGADVLRFGIPIVTRDMNTFSSRVVSSLIQAIGSGKDYKDTAYRHFAHRILISNTAMSYEHTAIKLTENNHISPSKFIDTTVAPLARQFKLRLLPLVGGFNYNTGINQTIKNKSHSYAPPPPYDYVDQAKKLEKSYRTMWEIRSILSQGFNNFYKNRTWSYEEVNQYKYPHIIVNPDQQN